MKMAELQFEAPLAKFDGEEWNDFHEFQTSLNINDVNTTTEIDNLSGEKGDDKTEVSTNLTKMNTGRSGVDNNFDEDAFAGSLEDLVNTFDEKITKCFFNYQENVEKLAPVQVRTQEEIMKDCQMWWTITGNFGNILPIDWSNTYARQLQTESLHLRDKTEEEPINLDLSDDEELQQAFDMHSLILSSLQTEPMFTADEVINEIEGMMDDGSMTPDSTASCSDMLSVSTELLHLKEKHAISPSSAEERHPGLKNLSTGALNELYEELECTIKEYSETLITELALRDELEFEKELKNQFISLLLTVQKKRRDTQADKKKNNNNIKKPRNGQGAEPGTHLTTVIPYHENLGPPSTEQLQCYIKILRAINEDSPSVPGLLTDYILKVLCPTKPMMVMT